jgi:hypothetical protein
LRVLEASTAAAARQLAAIEAPHLMIVDDPEASVLMFLPHSRAILIAHDELLPVMPAARLRVLARPFTAQGLLHEVSQSLA